MRLIKVTGGLGNQMFIYAMYLSMRKRFPDVRLDVSDMTHYKVHYGYEMNRVFGLPQIEFRMNWRLKKVVEFLFFKTILERKQDGSLRPYMKYYVWPFIYFKGFYQSEKYFRGIEDEVRKAFSFDMLRLNERTKELLPRLLQDEKAVSIHVRRGDYLQKKHWDAVGCICQGQYYLNAMKEMEKRVQNPHYYVFSEDMLWVRENLPLENSVFVDWNTGTDSWQDMMLMSHCRNHIICNSTFSWWGAWLNPMRDKIVVMPAKWSKIVAGDEMASEGWIQVPVN